MSTVATSPEVLAVLQRGTITGQLFVLPDERLERPLYQAVNAALNAAGGIWSKKQKGHLFADGVNVAEAVGVIVESKEFTKVLDPIKAKRDALQQFFTPPALAKRVVEMADIQAGNVVLEPSAGEGALVVEAYRQGAASVTAVEIDEGSAKQIPINIMEAAGEKPDGIVYVADFLTLKLPAEFDRVVMNPPFNKGQDIKHVARALELLAPGGILVAIVSPMTPKKEAFRSLVAGYRFEVDPVDPKTFEKTPIATAIVTIYK